MALIEKGFDASWGWPNLQQAWDAGYRAIAGYLSRDQSKNWTMQRIATARAIGFDCLFNFEDRTDNYLGGYQQGQTDATLANDEADNLGAPASVWIWYSVDTAASADAVRPYFQGIRSMSRRGIAGYGGSEILQLLHEGVILGWWEANALSWSGGKMSPDANVQQIIGHTLNAGGSTDEDWLYSTAGLWLGKGESIRTSITQEDDTMKLVAGSKGIYIIYPGGYRSWVSNPGDVAGLLHAFGQDIYPTVDDNTLRSIPFLPGTPADLQK